MKELPEPTAERTGEPRASAAEICPICEARVTPSPYVRYRRLEWVRCPECGGGWLTTYVSELDRDAEDFAAVYRGYAAARALLDAVAEEKARWLTSRWRPGMTIVEIGPGVGGVAAAVRRLQPQAPLVLVEPRGSFAAMLREAGFEVCSGEPQEALQAALSAVRTRGERLLAFLDNVLEHVPYPARFLATLHGGCQTGSRVLLEVPNEQGLAWRARLQDLLRGERKPPTFPGHINLFTRQALGRLGRRVTGQTPLIRAWPIRDPAQVAYLTQNAQVNRRIRLAIATLRVLPVDRLLGVSYWLRAEMPIGKAGNTG